MENIETAIEPRFLEYFIEAMAISHKAGPYKELAKVVPLPALKPKAETGAGDERKLRSRRRRRT